MLSRFKLLLMIGLVAIAPTSLFGQIVVPERFVQIRSIDFVNGVLELHNFGAVDENLGGWRFCSHDEDQDRRYSSAGGFNGVTLMAGQSLFIHYNNDASQPDEINRGAIGGNFALPLDTDGAYSIQIYFASGFGNGNNIADHVQLSRFGVDNVSADERSDEAQNGGVWTDQTTWVPVLPETERVVLLDSSSGNELHGPSDYENEFEFLLGDVSGDDAINLLDIAPFVQLISGGVYDPRGDMNLDG